MLPGVDSSIAARGVRAASAWSFYDRIARDKVVIGWNWPACVQYARDPLHLILAVELQLLQLDFFQEVFRIQVGRLGDFLKFCFVLPVLLCQTLILGVCFEGYVPR